MDDSSESTLSSSYQEEYSLLKKQYDEVLESNSQMVLRLEEAKLMLFKNTRELQSQNGTLMSENMNLRAQKEYLQQQLGKLGSLVGNLIEEMDTQKRSMARQAGYLDKLVCLVKSVAENKDNDLKNPETEANAEEENAPFLDLTALRELDKQLRASTVGSYYLPAIEEEHCGHDDDDESLDATRLRQPESREKSHEVQQKSVQGNSKSKGRTVSKIGRRVSSTTKKDAVENEALSQEGNRTGDESAQRTADETAEVIKNASDEENEQKNAPTMVRKSNNYMMANMEPRTSTLIEHNDSNHDSAQALKEKQHNCRDDRISKNVASEKISSNSKDTDHQNPNIQKDLPEANKEMPPVLAQIDMPPLTPNAIIVKNVATSYQAEAAQHKTSAGKYPKTVPGKSNSAESMQIVTKIQDKHVVEKVEKSSCRVELVDLFGAAQPNHIHKVTINPQKQTKAIALHQNMKTLSITRNGEVLELLESRDQTGREKPTNGSLSSTKVLTAQSSARCTTKDAAMTISPNYPDIKSNDALETQEIQSSSQTTARVSEISRAEQTKEPSNGLNKTPAGTTYSENKKSKLRKTQIIKSDASTTRSGESLKFEEFRDQPKKGKPGSGSRSSTNMSTGETSACYITKDTVTKISPSCDDIKANDAPTMRETQSSSLITARISEISQAGEPIEPLNGPNDTSAETKSSENKESKPKRRCDESQKLGECRDQPEWGNPANGSQSSTNMSTGILSSCCITKYAMMKTSQKCENTKFNAARIQDFQSHEIKGSEILQPPEHNPLNEPSDTLAETPGKENKPRKTRNIRGNANATENKTQHAFLPLARKSKYAKRNNSSSHSNLFTPVRDPSTSAGKNAPGKDFSLNLESTPDDNEARSASRKNGTFSQSKSCFLSPSMEDLRVSTARTLRESQMANSLLAEVRLSVASSKGESCSSDFATPKKVKRARHYGLGRKELVNLLSDSAAFQGNLGSEVMQEKRIMTRARSKPRRNATYNFSSTSETDEPNGDFEFKLPGRRPRRGAKK